MAERQAHGLINELRIKEQFGIQTYLGKQNYTAVYDGQTSNGTPVSIKTMKYRTDVELGDYWRNVNAQNDFYMVVSFWQGSKLNIVEEYHLLIPAEEWQKLFNRELDDEIRAIIQNASNERSYDTIWKEQIKALKEAYGNSLIRLRPKRDHKKQKRMQCAISYKDFLGLYEKYQTDDLRKNSN